MSRLVHEASCAFGPSTDCTCEPQERSQMASEPQTVAEGIWTAANQQNRIADLEAQVVVLLDALRGLDRIRQHASYCKAWGKLPPDGFPPCICGYDAVWEKVRVALYEGPHPSRFSGTARPSVGRGAVRTLRVGWQAFCRRFLRHPVWHVYGYAEGRFQRVCDWCHETW